MGVDSIKGSGGTTSLYDTQGIGGTETSSTGRSSGSDAVFPSSPNKNSSASGNVDNELPSLDAPRTQSLGYSALSLESLVTAIGNAESKQACAEGVDRLERRGEKINENNQLRMDEIEKNMETMRRQKTLGGFMKAFQWIGAILGAAASIAGVVVGGLTGNGLLIAGGLMGIGLAIDSMVSLGTDGEKSLAKGMTKMFEKWGMSEKAAYWLSFAINTTVTLTSVGLSMAGAIKGISAASHMAVRALAMTTKAQAIIQFISSANMVGQGAASTASSVYDYRLTMSQAQQMDIQAVLEDIKMAQEFEEAMIEAQMQRSNDLLSSVNDIIAESNATAMTIMTNAPAMV